MPNKKKVMIIAGEASGDLHTAKVVRQMQALDPHIAFTGIGGPAMAEAGVDLLYRAEDLALVGVSEVFGKLGHIWKAMNMVKRRLKSQRPDLLILTDFPDFNFRIAAYAKRLGLKVLYYVSPQVWAWRSGRAAKMARLVDHLAVVFPFEKDFYARKAPGLAVTFVGHPLLDEEEERAQQITPPWPFDKGKTVIGLLPGSRFSEITRLMPLMVETSKILAAKRPDLQFALPVAPGLDEKDLTPYLDGAAPSITFMPQAAQQVMRKADLLLIASGTATMQGALAATPMVVVYKTGNLNYFLGKRLIKVVHIAMPNLIAGHGLLPELIQNEANPKNLAHNALLLLEDETRRRHMVEGLKRVRQRLGCAGASKNVAQLAINMIGD